MISDTWRLYLQDALEERFPDFEVVFEPPGDYILPKPCIVYELRRRRPAYSNNVPYVIGREFEVTFLTNGLTDHDYDIMFNIPGVVVTNSNRHTTNGVVHEVFTVNINTI